MVQRPSGRSPPMAEADEPNILLAEMELLGESMSKSDKQLLLDMARKLADQVTGDE